MFIGKFRNAIVLKRYNFKIGYYEYTLAFNYMINPLIEHIQSLMKRVGTDLVLVTKLQIEK